jgi:hypothetical protein
MKSTIDNLGYLCLFLQFDASFTHMSTFLQQICFQVLSILRSGLAGLLFPNVLKLAFTFFFVIISICLLQAGFKISNFNDQKLLNSKSENQQKSSDNLLWGSIRPTLCGFIAVEIFAFC